LFIIKSKIQIESKSQLVISSTQEPLGCLSLNQRYKLKANHNYS